MVVRNQHELITSKVLHRCQLYGQAGCGSQLKGRISIDAGIDAWRCSLPSAGGAAVVSRYPSRLHPPQGRAQA